MDPSDVGVIQRLPTGFIDLLGLKSSGDAPHFTPAILGPSLEMRDLYESNRWVGQNGSTTTALAAGGIFDSSIVVPAGEQWLVNGLVAFVSLVVGNTLNDGRILIYNPQGSAYRISDVPFAACVGARYWSAGINDPFIMKSGDVVAIMTAPNTWATAQSISVNMRVCKLTV